MSAKKNNQQPFKAITPPDIGAMLKKFVAERSVFKSWWARTQGVKYDTVVKFTKKVTMQTTTLFTICQVLNYNFFRAIADSLPADMPPFPAANPVQKENDTLKLENEKLKEQVEMLKTLIRK